MAVGDERGRRSLTDSQEQFFVLKYIQGKSFRQNVYWPFCFQGVNTAFPFEVFSCSLSSPKPTSQIKWSQKSHLTPVHPTLPTPSATMVPSNTSVSPASQVLASSDWFVNHLHLSELSCFVCFVSSQGFISFHLQEQALLHSRFLAVCFFEKWSSLIGDIKVLRLSWWALNPAQGILGPICFRKYTSVRLSRVHVQDGLLVLDSCSLWSLALFQLFFDTFGFLSLSIINIHLGSVFASSQNTEISGAMREE